MLKSSQPIAAGLLTAVFASIVASQAHASPIRRESSSKCTSLGKGPLGFNSSDIGIYGTGPPQFYLVFPEDNSEYLSTSPLPKYDEPEMFEFFSCANTTPPEYEGDIEYFQGYIQSANGLCLTASALESQGAHFSITNCMYDNSSISGVDATQNFQVSTDTFYAYHAATFLGNTQGPVKAGFAAGGNYHYNLAPLPDSSDSSEQFLTLNYLANEPNGGNLGTDMILQLGSEFKQPKRQLGTCRLFKSGPMVLADANDPTKTSNVTITDIAYPENIHTLVVNNGTIQSYGDFEFHVCDSQYMGYTSNATAYFGHMQLGGQEANQCWTRKIESSGPISQLYLDGSCPETDDNSQLNYYFRLDVTSDGYEVSYLNSTKYEKDPAHFGWKEVGDGESQIELLVNPAPDAQGSYKLRFKD